MRLAAFGSSAHAIQAIDALASADSDTVCHATGEKVRVRLSPDLKSLPQWTGYQKWRIPRHRRGVRRRVGGHI